MGLLNFTQAQLDSIITAINNRIKSSEKGAANGVASLGADGKVPSSQLPGQSAPGQSAIIAIAQVTGSAQAISSSTWTKAIFGNELTDTNGFYDNTNGRFKPSVAGWYSVFASLSYNSIAASNYCAIRKNGSDVNVNVRNFGAGQPSLVEVPALVYLNGTTDYIEIYGYSTASNGFYAGYSSMLQINYIGV